MFCSILECCFECLVRFSVFLVGFVLVLRVFSVLECFLSVFEWFV